MQTALIDGTKTCSKCQAIKPLVEFHRDRSAPMGLCYYCKSCATQSARENHKKYAQDPKFKSAKRSSYLKHRYGLTELEYTNKLASQGNVCAICSIELKPTGGLTHLDHDHITGKLREFLCTNCNRGLGHFQDSPRLLSKARDYLERYLK